MAAEKLGPWEGVYNPGYQLVAYKNGDPTKPIRGVDWRSATRIATSKSIDDIVGTFDITMKDSRAREHVGPMDVVKIRMRGHNQGWGTVLRGVTDFSGPNESAGPTSAQQDTEVSGRCSGKYLQINSMFLPAWDPLANLPTALTFGVGDASGKLGTNVAASTPRAIFGYIFDHFVVGQRNRVGLSGTPNARFWLSRKNRFEWVPATNGKPFQVPFVQFDEDTTDTALTRLTIQGFTEGWVDEVGNVVYRRPGWDRPVSWVLHTSGLISDTLQDSDIGLPTYVEVFPGAMPAVSSGQAQALLAGRAPIPSDYVTGLRASGFRSIASPQFIIDVDATGKPTAAGRRNWYYQRQKKYGLRPYQITSPLLASREQAQAQAEGLLRFMLRWQKSGTVTIPGEPNVRLGQTILLVGSLRGQRISRVYYISGIAHEYVEGDHYTTTLTLTHGRDPWDPHWVDVALPQFSASQLAEASGILGGGSPSSKDTSLTLPTGQSSISGYVNPVGDWAPSRVDQGVDGTLKAAFVAPANSTILYARTSDPGWLGGGYIAGRIDDGPQAGLVWFAAEGIAPNASLQGQQVTAGTKVAALVSNPYNGIVGNIETGWADPSSPTRPLAQSLPGYGGDQSAQAIAAGSSYNRWLGALGAAQGTVNTTVTPATLPAGYP